jgi:nucleoside-diphosphate-sugar epimerase
VHAAVFTPSRTSNIETDRSRSIVDINLVGTADLLDMARVLDTERFLYVSSEAVYGDGPGHGEMLGEDAILYPRNLYAVAKYASELLTRRYGELHSFQTVSVRLSYPYGPMERVTGHRTRMSQIYRWTGNAVRGEPVQVEDRTVGHDYTYAADVASGISALLDAPSLSHDVYNLSAGRSITLGEVIEALREARPSLKVIDNTPGEPEGLLPSPGTQIRDVTRIQEDLGFTPSFDIAAGIRDYLKWREDFSFRD